MKIKTMLLILFLFSNNLQAIDWLAELRGGYFYPTSKKFREIYRDGGPEVELELSKTFKKDWMAWANVNYFERSGHSIGFHDKTTINMVPVSFGFKYLYPICNFPINPYLGGGVTYTFINVKNDADFVKRHVTKSGVGFVVKSGMYVDLCYGLILDIFADYYYQKIHFYSKNNEDVGGFKMGLGLGYKF